MQPSGSSGQRQHRREKEKERGGASELLSIAKRKKTFFFEKGKLSKKKKKKTPKKKKLTQPLPWSSPVRTPPLALSSRKKSENSSAVESIATVIDLYSVFPSGRQRRQAL